MKSLSKLVKEATEKEDQLQQVKDDYKFVSGRNLTDKDLIDWAKKQLEKGRTPHEVSTLLYAFGPQKKNEVFVQTKTKMCPNCKAAKLKYDTDTKAFWCDRCERYSEPDDVNKFNEDLPPQAGGGSGEGLTKNPNQTELNESPFRDNAKSILPVGIALDFHKPEANWLYAEWKESNELDKFYVQLWKTQEGKYRAVSGWGSSPEGTAGEKADFMHDQTSKNLGSWTLVKSVMASQIKQLGGYAPKAKHYVYK